MLDKITEFYDQEVEATTEALTGLIEPLMIAFLGGIDRVDDHRAVHADLQDLRPHPVASVLDAGPRARAARRGPAGRCASAGRVTPGTRSVRCGDRPGHPSGQAAAQGQVHR